MVVAHFGAFKYFIFVVADTNIIAPVKRKLEIDISDQTTIQKKARFKIARKRNENTTLLENLATEEVSSSQTEVEFCQNEYEQRQVVEEEDGKQEEFEEHGKINEVQEEEEENTEVVVVAQQEKIN